MSVFLIEHRFHGYTQVGVRMNLCTSILPLAIGWTQFYHTQTVSQNKVGHGRNSAARFPADNEDRIHELAYHLKDTRNVRSHPSVPRAATRTGGASFHCKPIHLAFGERPRTNPMTITSNAIATACMIVTIPTVGVWSGAHEITIYLRSRSVIIAVPSLTMTRWTSKSRQTPSRLNQQIVTLPKGATPRRGTKKHTR